MIRVLVAIMVGTIFLLWLVIMLPGWIMGMMFAGQIMLLPDAPRDLGYWGFVAALYLPPILAGATVTWLVKTRRRNRMTAATHASADTQETAA